MPRIVNEPAEITIPNIADAEVSAMTQAMYSRSQKRIKVRLEELNEEGEEQAKASLSKFYLGYGHASINDCGFTTIYVEGVSNILAKAIEDTQLFNGQESSTRYLDYSNQSIIDPYNSESSKQIIEGWLQLYLKYQPKVVEGLYLRYPKGVDESQTVYETAIKARSFDIMRGYLPCGVTTQLSWTTSLRHARDRIRILVNHPVEEVVTVAKQMHAMLLEKYPSSFKADDIHPAPEYVEFWKRPEFHYIEHDESEPGIQILLNETEPFVQRVTQHAIIDPEMLEVLANRPTHAPIPTIYSEAFEVHCLGILDFGSYRDIQRHRRGYCPIPLVKDYGLGIHEWYDTEVEESLSEEDYKDFENIVDGLMKRIKLLEDVPTEYDKFKHQYLYPLGIKIFFEFKYNMAQCAYVSELRSQPTVHETLRPIAQLLGNTINRAVGVELCRVNNDPAAFVLARGKQTIFKDGKEIE